ncbi:MAG: CHAT domain-containing protein, partial [Chloroflexales bacterium]|nr:CHAT domain-containing protein [Chloroflexales bacterium]
MEITEAGAGFTVEVQSAYGVGGLPPQQVALPFAPGQLPQARRNVADWIKQARITTLRGSEESKLARRFGGTLFQALFSAEVLAAFRASRAALSQGQRLHVRLRLPPQLALLPWELLYDANDDQFLALAPDLALVRYADIPRPSPPLRVAGALQVVAVLASPQSEDFSPIRLDRELRRIEGALKAPVERGQIALDVIRGPGTLDQLRARLRRPVHVLHVLCHGDLDASGGEGVLVFEDTDGAPEPVNAELLRLQLQKQRGQTQLVLLNACLGAITVGNDPFSSVGAALLRGGVPAVIAMQFEVAEDTAAELARVFYAELASGAPLDIALTEARLHLYGRYPNQLDWSIPVLFLRSENDLIFEVTPAPLPQTVAHRPTVEPPTPAPAGIPVQTLASAKSDAAPTQMRRIGLWWLLAPGLLLLLIMGYIARNGLQISSKVEPITQQTSATQQPGAVATVPGAASATSAVLVVASATLAAPSQVATEATVIPAPPSGRIAFVSRASNQELFQIHLVNADGSGRACLTCAIPTAVDKV